MTDVELRPESRQTSGFAAVAGNYLADTITNCLGDARRPKNTVGYSGATFEELFERTAAVRALDIPDNEITAEVAGLIGLAREDAKLKTYDQALAELKQGYVTIIEEKDGRRVYARAVVNHPQSFEALLAERLSAEAIPIEPAEELGEQEKKVILGQLVSEFDGPLDDIADLTDELFHVSQHHRGLAAANLAGQLLLPRFLSSKIESHLHGQQSADRISQTANDDKKKRIDRKARIINEQLEFLQTRTATYLADLYVRTIRSDEETRAAALAKKELAIASGDLIARAVDWPKPIKHRPQRPAVEGSPASKSQPVIAEKPVEPKIEAVERLADYGELKFNFPWLSDGQTNLPVQLLETNGQRVFIVRAMNKRQEEIAQEVRRHAGSRKSRIAKVTATDAQVTSPAPEPRPGDIGNGRTDKNSENELDAKTIHIAKLVSSGALRPGAGLPNQFRRPLENLRPEYGKQSIFGWAEEDANGLRIYFSFGKLSKYVAEPPASDTEATCLVVMAEFDFKHQREALAPFHNYSRGTARDLYRRAARR